MLFSQQNFAYLSELRKRCLSIILLYLAIFLVCWWQSGWLYNFFARPLTHLLPALDTFMIATDLMSGLLVPLRLAFWLAFVAVVPVLLLQLWQFVRPALYPKERKMIITLLILALGLFLAGLLFAYFILVPLSIKFLLFTVPSGVKILPDITSYLSFMGSMLLGSGLGFQLPVVILLLVKLRVLSLAQLKTNRPYIIIGVLVLTMLLTPPDIVSHVLLAVPILMLFELSLVLSKLMI